jgi:hypothetical protein
MTRLVLHHVPGLDCAKASVHRPGRQNGADRGRVPRESASVGRLQTAPGLGRVRISSCMPSGTPRGRRSEQFCRWMGRRIPLSQRSRLPRGVLAAHRPRCGRPRGEPNTRLQPADGAPVERLPHVREPLGAGLAKCRSLRRAGARAARRQGALQAQAACRVAPRGRALGRPDATTSRRQPPAVQPPCRLRGSGRIGPRRSFRTTAHATARPSTIGGMYHHSKWFFAIPSAGVPAIVIK